MIPSSVLVTVVGLAVIGLIAAFVYRDATRLEFQRPWLWAAFVATTMLSGLVLYVAVETVPVPGLLVIVLVGIVFYLFERDDAIHGDDEADPHELPVQPGSDGDSRAPLERTDDDPEPTASGSRTDADER
ncbi:hypothetical protein [Natronosalvus vescus]|uniref:hypothetical protein n=1 Tax=Natronosalvus vescus TaxID=2953881 RepID=UPI00209177D5|nr:hypothetical protein [Natronosalvus vescus]